jgi:hypothetical protein
MSVLDDHDHVYGEKLRFATRAANDHQATAAAALRSLTLGIPCLYYGTEQGFAGPEKTEWQWLPEWGGHDRYLREAMFGPRFQGRRAGPEFQEPVAGTVLIINSADSDHLAPRESIASTPTTRCTCGLRQLRLSAPASRSCAPVASTCGKSRYSANHGVRHRPGSCLAGRGSSSTRRPSASSTPTGWKRVARTCLSRRAQSTGLDLHRDHELGGGRRWTRR